MKIIPAINCPDFECVQSKLAIIKELDLNEAIPWIHIDIADGGFTKGYTTWRNPEELKKISGQWNIELHLMVNDPELILEQWRVSGVRRVIVHLEAISNVESVLKMCADLGVEPVLSSNPETPATHILQYLSELKTCHVQAVEPGLSGQVFQETALLKIKAIRAAYPDIEIAVDGGINLETGARCKKAGATTLEAASAIFNSADPAAAYRVLAAL